MEPKLLPYFFFSTGLAGLGVSIVLISSKKFFQNMYLSLCMFSLSLCAIYNFCYVQGLLPEFPFLFILAKSFIFLLAPAGYLYIRNIFNPEKAFRVYDWIHAIPFLMVILFLTNTSLRNPDAIQRAMTDSSVNWFVDVSNADIYFNLSIAKSLLWLFYAVLQSIYIINFERGKAHKLPQLNHRLLNWVKIFNITLFMLFFILLVQRIINISYISLDFVNDTTMSFILLLTLSFLIFSPHILYGLTPIGLNLAAETHSSFNYSNTDVADDKTAYIKPLYNSKRKDEYLLILDDVLAQKQPYLHKGITVKDLSDQTGIPPHHLSSLISNEFNLHFQDFINLQRIEYLKNHISDIGWKQLTLEGICWEIGFTSRTTFFRAFIKFTGLSPSEYFNSMKKNNHSA
ncbi:MAG TPA: helix-turn-helix domain-containing protein [Mucilaginibacter sp.]|jgi:AraC-like DNA-binding protein